MPIPNESLVKQAASFKREASKEFDKIVKALIDLVWSKRKPSADFLFENDPQLDAEANELLQGFSDTLVEKAKRLAEAIIRESLEGDYPDAWEQADGEDYDSILFRFDMQGSHLKDLLQIWIALAVVNNIGKSELRVLISRYLNNPFTSPLWMDIPLNALIWGRGYSKNILEQIAIIGQNAIFGAARFAEWLDEKANGATYYIRRRGSSYDCDVCDDLANKPIPIDEPFEIPHSRCCCWPEYHYEPMTL